MSLLNDKGTTSTSTYYFNAEILIEEYLSGTEHVSDIVSRDGVHKVSAVWEYCKRPVNSAPFVISACAFFKCRRQAALEGREVG